MRSPISTARRRTVVNPAPRDGVTFANRKETLLRAALACAGATLVVALALLGVGRADAAADHPLKFRAGQACAFPLRIDSTGTTQVNKEFDAPDGTVRFLSAGTGSDLVFTNLSAKKTYSLAGNGAVTWTRIDAAGSARLTLTGHNIVIYFPSDHPAGPSTTLVEGREDIDVDLATFEFTRISRTGSTTDICAALS
jgi:hypothetical protein